MQITNYNSAVAGDATKATLGQGGTTVGVQIAGAFTGSFTFEATVDGSTYLPIDAYPSSSGASQPQPVQVATAPGIWVIQTAGMTLARVRATALTVGTPVVTLQSDERPL